MTFFHASYRDDDEPDPKPSANDPQEEARRRAELGALEVFAETLLGGSRGNAIMNQERRGQQDFAVSDTLPLEGLTTALCKQLVAVGFEIETDAAGNPKPSENDDLFVRVKLPAGWKKQPTDHSMHTDLLDDKGRQRGSIFYKAAYYDRKASLSMTCRFHCSTHTDATENRYADNTDYYGVVIDGDDTLIWRTADTAVYGNYKATRALQAEARTWLAEHYPDYENPMAYWDTPATLPPTTTSAG